MAKRPAYIRHISRVKPFRYARPEHGIAAAARDIGAAVGTKLIGVDVCVIAPGKNSSRFHRHKHKEEFFYVLSGRCRVRIGRKFHDLKAGDAVSRLAGAKEAHQFSNPTRQPCSVLMFGVMAGQGVQDVIAYPDLGKILLVGSRGGRRWKSL